MAPRTRKKNKQKLTMPPLAKSIKPGTNFFGYVNANWIRHVNMPSYLSSYSVSEEIEDQIEPQLENIINSARKDIMSTANKNLEKDTLLIGNLYQSAMDRGTQPLSIKFVKNILANIRCIRDKDDVAITIAEFAKYHVSNAINIYVNPEELHSTQLRIVLGPGKITLPDSSYYTVQAPGRIHLLDVYNNMLLKLGDIFDVNNLQIFIGIERIIAEALQEAKGENEILMNGAELKRKYKSIPWPAFARAAFSITEEEFNHFKVNVSSPIWLKYLNRWFKQWPIDNWRAWFSGALIMDVLPLLPPPFDDMHFEFFDKRLRGQTEKTPQHVLGAKMCKTLLSASLGKKYINCCVKSELKRSVTAIANEILDACVKRLADIDWLEAKTKEKAKLKVKNVVLCIAYPDTMPPSPDVELDPEQFIKNIFALETAHYMKDLKRANTMLNPAKWEDAVFEVNAYYYNEGNRLIIPAGILNYPFYDINSSDGWNFGGIGAIIGHELTHAFDMDGKDYDEHGNNYPWWTAKDNRNYSQKTKSIIAIFNKTRYFNQYINGTLTLSENIADLGGLALALAALKNHLERKKLSKENYKAEICNFFISYAVSWRVKEKRKKAIQSLITDMHAPSIARVNNIVCQFDDWYDCFGVEPGNYLYVAPQDRIRIF